MGRYFGTDGIRGEANVTLTALHAYKIGAFFGWYLSRFKSPAKVLIGKDTRRSGDMLESALVAGLTEYGANAYLLHVVPTPAVAYLTKHKGFDCGVVISASHNPFYDNGIKLFNSNGEKTEEEILSLAEDYLDGKEEFGGEKVEKASAGKIGRSYDYSTGRKAYVDFLVSVGKKAYGGGGLGGLKIGLDCANGAAYNIAGTVYKKLGATVFSINARPNSFNINDNAGSTHIEGLCKFVKENGLDVGFAYDGDADRCLCVDENGNVVNGDKILYICGNYLKSRDKLANSTVVTTVMSNFGLYKAFDKAGIKYAKTAVGDKYVYEYMSAHGNRLGGEQSGHIIFSKYATTGDGILTSIKILEVMIAGKAKLSELAAPVKEYPQVLVNVKVTDKQAAQEDADVKAAVKAAEQKLGDSGRILVRASGTEPLIRVMVESESAEECKKLAESVVSVVAAKGYKVNN